MIITNPALNFLRIPDLVKNKYQSTTHSAALSKIEDAISSNQDLTRALQGSIQESASTEQARGITGGGGDSGSRTVASPDFAGETLPNFTARVDFDPKPAEDFFTGRTLF